MTETSRGAGEFVVGIDAGGTSLRIRGEGGGVAPVEVVGASQPDGGPDAVIPHVRAVSERRGSAAAVCAGITKITRGDTAARWEAVLRYAMPGAVVSVVPDYVIAHHGAIDEGVGLSVVAGTGSVIYGEDGRGRAVRVGGRGWEFGDEGSGAWLTTEVVRRTLRALDGLEEPTPLTRAACVELGTEEPAAFGEAARGRGAEEGRGFFVPLALGLARAGDLEAKNLFVGAAGWLGAYARAAAARLALTDSPEVPVATIGGMWNAGELLTVPFETVVRRWVPGARVHPPLRTPVEGAVLLARHSLLRPPAR